jgi:hypothetical protein
MVSPLNVGAFLLAACIVGIFVLSRLLLPRLLSFVVRSGGMDGRERERRGLSIFFFLFSGGVPSGSRNTF